MKIVTTNNDAEVADFHIEQYLKTQAEMAQQREKVIGPCPEADVLDLGHFCAEILPDGTGRVTGHHVDDALQPPGTWDGIFIPFNRLVHAVLDAPGLRNLPNGTFVRVSVEISDKWADHPLNPDEDGRLTAWSMGEWCDLKEILLTEPRRDESAGD